MAVWLSALTKSPTVNFDTRKWSRFTGTGASATKALILAGIELDMTAVSGAASTNETLFTLTPATTVQSWTGAVRFTPNTPGSDSATQQFNSYLWLNHDGVPQPAGAATNGYCLDFTVGAIKLRKFVAGVGTTLGSINALDLTKKYRIRFERTATAIRARVWEDGTTEPTDWNVYTGALDGAIGSGRGAVSQFRYRATKSGAFWSDLIYSATGVRPFDGPKNFRTFEGRAVGKGRSRSVLACGMLDATQPSLIVGTTTFDAATLRRTLTAGANSSVTLAFPAIPAAAVELIQLDVENVAFDANTGVTYQIGFLAGSTAPLAIEENASYGATRIVVGGATRDLKAQVFATNTSPATQEQGNHRNLRVALLPRLGELQAGEGESGLYGGGWSNVGVITGTVTPTITLTATGAAARSMSFTRVALTLEAN